jgi:Kef-type K+ transport system membrane component KefB
VKNWFQSKVSFQIHNLYRYNAGVAAGTALSSTSIGLATKMMQNVGMLNTPLGSLICVAAMVRGYIL